MSLANKYRPNSFEDVVEQPIVVDILKNMCEKELENRNFLLTGPAGTGKAQPLYAKVLTKAGYTTIGELSIGDTVIDGNGIETEIDGVFDRGIHKIYRITLSDRTYYDVADDHLNSVFFLDETHTHCNCIIDTEELATCLDRGSTFYIPTVIIHDMEDENITVDPYFLGYYITSKQKSVCNLSIKKSVVKHEQVLQKLNQTLNQYNLSLFCDGTRYKCIPYDKESVKFVYNGKTYDSCLELFTTLSEIGYPYYSKQTLFLIGAGLLQDTHASLPSLNDCLSLDIDFSRINTKLQSLLDDLLCGSTSDYMAEYSVPKNYLYASLKTRFKLLQGILDASGVISDKNIEFRSANKQLVEDVAFLIRSIGGTATVYMSDSYRYRIYGKLHSLCNPFCENIAGYHDYSDKTEPLRKIVSVEAIDSMECRCIHVKNSCHTYITDNVTVTHNTTLARIIGNKINGNSNEQIEIDAASNGTVDAIRNIIQQAKAFPVNSKYKVFIIDECHAISTAGFQALLKTLEESPAKSVFILCTTNPEKIPDTILSRVQIFRLSKISTESIEKRLQYVLDSEIQSGNPITYDTNGISYVAKLANGGMRDALTMLDKVLAFSNVINQDSVIDALGIPSYDTYFQLISAIGKKNNEEITKIINTIYNSGTNFMKWMEQFQSFVVNIVKYIYLRDIKQTIIPANYLDKISNYTTAHSAFCLKLSMLLSNVLQQMKESSYPQEIAITYLCTSR